MDRPQSLLEQHEALRLLTDRLHLIASSQDDVLPEPNVRTLLQHEIAGLRRELAAHFASESQGGYLREVVERRPKLRRQVAALEAEHDKIIEALDSLTQPGAPQSLPDVKRAVLRILIGLKRHEIEEVALLQGVSGP